MYEAKTFDIGELDGISKESIDLQLGLYAGYVKHVNLIREEMQRADNAGDAYARAEMQRRLGFEFGGMKNHEYYFSQFEGGAQALPDGALKDMVNATWGSFDAWKESFITIAKTRGVGWAILYIDREANQLVQTWVDEQHQGHLGDIDIVLALDMWEHSYMRDYLPSDKGSYIEAFFKNLNWKVIAERV